MAQSLPGRRHRSSSEGRASAGQAAHYRRAASEAGSGDDPSSKAGQRHPLVDAHYGVGGGDQRGQRAPHLARPWSQTTSGRTFKVSNDPQFAEKLEDVVGLYLDPPEHALVFCVDEKSQIQALDRTQPGLPMKKGRCGTMTHDYKRNGTATLFAALNALEGEVISMCDDRHRHQEWLKFLRVIDKVTRRTRTST